MRCTEFQAADELLAGFLSGGRSENPLRLESTGVRLLSDSVSNSGSDFCEPLGERLHGPLGERLCERFREHPGERFCEPLCE